MTIHRKTLIGSAALVALAASAPAFAKKAQVTPYLEVAQVLTADLKGDSDVLTYSTVAAGIDASISNARSEAQINYRYERRFDYGKNVNDQDIQTGLARGRFGIVPNRLNIEAGGIATRARQDIRGSAPGLLVGNVDNIVQVYSVFAGPTLTTNIGGLKVSGAYRLGYTRAEAGKFTPGPGQPAVDQFDDSVTNFASASVGKESGSLPFGWTVSGTYRRDDAGQLDQRFESKTVRGDVVVPVSPTLALVGGVGYEDIEASQRSPLIDANGQPVVGSDGRFVTDKSSPRQLAYDQDGLFYDAGVVYRPNRRTNLEARVGKRFGGLSYTGSATYQSSSATAFQVNVFDQIDTFAQQLNDNLALLPTSFTNFNNPLNSQVGGCLFGGGGSSSSQAGGCLNPAFQSVNGAVFRSRGITGLMSTNRGPLNIGFGAGYAQRKYRAPNGGGTIFSLNGVRDESYFAQGQIAYQIDDVSNINAQVFASLFDSGIAGAPNVLSTGATGAYNRTFGRNLSTTAAVGLFSSRVDGQEGDLTGTALLGLRYSF